MYNLDYKIIAMIMEHDDRATCDRSENVAAPLAFCLP